MKKNNITFTEEEVNNFYNHLEVASGNLIKNFIKL